MIKQRGLGRPGVRLIDQGLSIGPWPWRRGIALGVSTILTGCAPQPGRADSAAEAVGSSAWARAESADSAANALSAAAAVGNGVSVLNMPADLVLARRVVREFFDAVSREDLAQLDELLSEDAYLTWEGTRQPARVHYRNRFSKVDYAALEGQLIYYEREIQAFTARYQDQLGHRRRSLPELTGDDVLLLIPVHATHVGTLAVFGDELALLLRPKNNRYLIAVIREDFRLP